MKKHIDYPARTLVVRLLATTAIMVCGLSGFNACAAMIATHTTIAAADTTYDGQDIVVSNCTLTVNGPHTFASLVLTNNALLTHTPAPNGETNNRLLLSITGDATIAAGCQVDVAGRGYGAGTGPGAGIVAYNGGSGGGGGSHGGKGAYGAGSYGEARGSGSGNVYNRVDEPSQWGSSGGAGNSSTPGAGGGFVKLTVGGVLQVDGHLAADGTDSTRPGGGSYAGGGSGGSIWLNVGRLIGAGLISANGGSGAHGGGGGGGRIAIYCGTYSFLGSWRVTGGAGFQRGGAGTFFFRNDASARGWVCADNNSQSGAPTILNATLWPAGEDFDFVATGAALVYPQGPVTLASLRINGGALLSHGAAEKTFDLTVTGDAVIESNGQINVAGLGYPVQTGPGAGGIAYNGNGGGGGHGGGGGGAQIPYSYQGAGGVYDSVTQPADFGSGGGEYRGGAGGGSIRLTVKGTFQLDGRVNACGADAVDSHYGAGAGGSIWLRLGALTGGGVISATGGQSGSGPGGGGGGGRIAIYYGANSFSGSLTVSGGPGIQRGAAGTIFTRDTAAAHGQALVDNSGYSGVPTVLNATLWPAGEVFDLIASGAAVVYPQGPITLANLRVNGGAILSHGAAEKTFDLTVTGDAVIESNGQINVAGLGYPVQTGPGAGGIAYNGNGGGGGHGGGGGGAQIPGGGYQAAGGTYGSPTQPADFGSGGGEYRGGAGGGAIRLTVSGALQLDGRVNAYGADAVDSHSGAGAGGSIWLQLGALKGAGFISAAGGWSGGPGGGGGGGRVAIYCGSFSGFDTNGVSVAGGSGGRYGGAGADGTIRLLPLGQASPSITLARGGGRAFLTWPGFGGLRYQLLSTTNLTAPVWGPVGDPIVGQAGLLSTNVPISSDSERYFRIQVLNE